jgi:hypothetical protein
VTAVLRGVWFRIINSMCILINLLAPEFGIWILAHPVCKMRIIQEPKKLSLWNKWYFEEEKMECVPHV